VRLQNVTFDAWLKSHESKKAKERWLRELYPWPVLALVDCDEDNIGRTQQISYDGANYNVTLISACRQTRGTFKYRVRVEADGLGWHARSFSDEYDLCGKPDGTFVTLFHTKKEEPLERIAKAFFGRRWTHLRVHSFRSLAVSRFLAASIVAQVVEGAFQNSGLAHYPSARLIGGAAPMFARGANLWIGYRFFSEDAYAWARRSAGSAEKIIALYFADTKHQFRTDLPTNIEVKSIAEFDACKLGGQFEEFIRVLLRGLELPDKEIDTNRFTSIVSGQTTASCPPISEADVHEALAALKRPCASKSELRYQLAAAVVLNAWIEDERRLGFDKRKKFYAFKQKVGELAEWARKAQPSGVTIWAEKESSGPILYVRIDGVDFSFQAIPGANVFLSPDTGKHNWTGVRLKPIAPIVLAWAKALRRQTPNTHPVLTKDRTPVQSRLNDGETSNG